MSDNKKYVHDSEFNRRLIKITEHYTALLKVTVKSDLKKMQEGAWALANKSKNPKLKELCKELDKLEIK